jgi:hypothetical protein
MTTLNDISLEAEEATVLPRPAQSSLLPAIAVVLFAFSFGLYFVARYHGLWLTGDLANLVGVAQDTAAQKRLVIASTGVVGIGDALLLKTLADFTGVVPLAFAQTVLPLLIALVAVSLLSFYRAVALKFWLVAVLLMLVQPVFVSNLINSALIFGWLLVVTNYELQVPNLKRNNSFVSATTNPFPLLPHLSAFIVQLLLLLVLIFYDRYLAIIVLAVLSLGLVLNKIKSLFLKDQSVKSLPTLVVLVPVWLVWLVSLLVVPLPPVSSQSFVPDFAGWLNPAVYFALNAVSLLILIIGLVGWLRQTKKLTGQIWGWYGASWLLCFATPLLPSAYAGTLWAMLLLCAIPFALEFLGTINQKALFNALISVLILYSGISTTLLVTRDPLVSQQWQFISKAEQLGYQWSEQFLEGEKLWVGFEGQLPAYAALNQAKNIYQTGEKPSPTLLLSQRLEVWANQRLKALPDTVEKNRIYDNGKTQVYR